jgi:flagellar hook-basal body complex protein FliE
LNLDSDLNAIKKRAIEDISVYLNLLKSYNSVEATKNDADNFRNIGAKAINSFNELQKEIDNKTDQFINNNFSLIKKSKTFGIIIVIS